MAEFVNYNKRGIDLPAGCKDLGDLLKRQPGVSKKHAQKLNFNEERFHGTMADIQFWVAKVFQFKARVAGLMISPPAGQLSFTACRTELEPVCAHFTFGADRNTEKQVRRFYAAHGLHQPQSPWSPNLFQRNHPVSPMPSEPQPLARIATDFFCDVGGLSEESVILFQYFEGNHMFVKPAKLSQNAS